MRNQFAADAGGWKKNIRQVARPDAKCSCAVHDCGGECKSRSPLFGSGQTIFMKVTRMGADFSANTQQWINADACEPDLHIRCLGDNLIITELHGLHDPGIFWVARYLSDVAGYSVFQLLTQIPGLDTMPPRFRGGTGAATLRFRNRRHSLKLVSRLDLDGQPQDICLEASEV